MSELELADISSRLKSMLSKFGFKEPWVQRNLEDALAEIEKLRADMREIASQCHNLPRSATADRIDQIARREPKS